MSIRSASGSPSGAAISPPSAGSSPACVVAAPTNSRNSGSGRFGRELNSGWNWEATKKGGSGNSIISTRRPSGGGPPQPRPRPPTRGSVGGGPPAAQAPVPEPAAQLVVDLVTVAVALVDDRLAVDLSRPRALVQLDRVGAEAHRAAHVGDFLLLGQEIDDRVGRLGVELGGVGALHAG